MTIDPFATLPPIDDDLLTLRADLAVRAARADLLDVAYRRIDSPVGPLLVASTAAGLVRVAFAREDFDAVLQSLAEKLSPRILLAPQRLDSVVRELDEYFAGQRHEFSLALDYSLSTGFRRDVLTYLPDISYGHIASYAAVARAVGNPKAVRAVGSACATNPLPLVVPCHRVVRSDGQLGAYLGGAEAKQVLRSLETAA